MTPYGPAIKLVNLFRYSTGRTLWSLDRMPVETTLVAKAWKLPRCRILIAGRWPLYPT